MSGESEGDNAAALSAAVLRGDEGHYVVLPCEPSQFGGFVSGLLGKTQVLKGIVDGVFDVTSNEIENVFHLVNTRVGEQNEGSLVHFSITVHYSNGTSITHNDVSKFRSYSPVDSCHPFEVVLNFTYLIKFPAETVPKKQEIEVAVIAEGDSRNGSRRFVDGVFEYKIDYTNRTWATDVGSLLKNHGETFVEKTSGIKRWLRDHSDVILLTICSLVAMFSILFFCVDFYKDIPSYLSASRNLSDGVASCFKELLVGGAVLSILVLFLNWIYRVSEFSMYLPLRSFIVLSEQDVKRRKRAKRRMSYRWGLVVASWVFSVVAGLVANYINSIGLF